MWKALRALGFTGARTNRVLPIAHIPIKGQIKPIIATPCYEGVKPRYAGSMAETAYWLGKNGLSFRYPDPAHNFDVPNMRNVMVAHFMASDCDPLVFIDSDMGWTAEAFFRLLSASQIHDVCCSTYPKKTDPLKPKEWTHSMPQTGEIMWHGGREFIKPRVHPVTHFVEVAACGTGFMAIRRAALERVVAVAGDPVLMAGAPDDGLAYQLFKVAPVAGGDGRLRLATEDHVFCHLWREVCGGEIWCDPLTVLDHVGDHTWSGGMGELVMPLKNAA